MSRESDKALLMDWLSYLEVTDHYHTPRGVLIDALLSLRETVGGTQMIDENAPLDVQVSALTAENERLRAEVERIKADDPMWFARMDCLEADRERIRAERDRLRLDLASVSEERDKWIANFDHCHDALGHCRFDLAALRAAGQAALNVMPHDPRAWVPGHAEAYDALRAALAESEEESGPRHEPSEAEYQRLEKEATDWAAESPDDEGCK